MRDHVRRLLLEHCPFDLTENAHCQRMSRLLDLEDDPFARDTYIPGHFTSSAFVLSPDRSAILLVLHSKLRRWLQPGGHFEAVDGSVVDAARREVLEETGLEELTAESDSLLDIDVHEIPAHGDQPAHQHHDLRVLFTAGHSAVAAGDGVDAVRFVPFDELEHITTDVSVMRAVEKIQGRLRQAERQAEA